MLNIWLVIFPLRNYVQMMIFYLSCRPSGSICYQDTANFTSIFKGFFWWLFLSFRLFNPWNMIETRFHVILGNVKCDWPGFVGFLQLWYWRETSFPKDGAGTRQANDIVWLQNWKYPWIKLCDELLLFLSQVWFIVAFPKILHCWTLGKQLPIYKP